MCGGVIRVPSDLGDCIVHCAKLYDEAGHSCVPFDKLPSEGGFRICEDYADHRERR